MTRHSTMRRPAIDAFCAQWPCHGIPTTLASITFWFADNGDLVDILAKSRNGRRVDSSTFDGPALVALSQDAKAAIVDPDPTTKWTLYDAVAACEGFDGLDHDRDELVEAWQFLIDTGAAWTLQGWFGRAASQLIHDGVCHMAPVAS